MVRESGGRRGPRRPRRGEEREPVDAKERVDRDFAREIEMRISYFLKSEETELELEAMNSYRRRMVHNIAGKYHLKTESRGEDRGRYVCLIKSEETAAPASGDARPPRLWDFGSQTFVVNPGPQGVRMALKADGSVELLRESERSHVLADRLITSREFRIRKGQFVQPGEPGY